MSRSAARILLVGGLVVGILDGLDAIVFFGLRGVAAHRIFQSIAAGLLGPASFRGGWRTVVLGVALHFFIATCIVGVAYLIGRAIPRLVENVVAGGALYGVGAYAVMNLLVIPLSRAASGSRAWPVVLNGLLIHVFGVGIPSVLFGRRAIRRAR